MNIKTRAARDLTLNGDNVIWTEMQVPSLLIVIGHEFIYTWQLVPLEFNLSTLVSQTNPLPSINSFRSCVKHAFFNCGIVQDGWQNCQQVTSFCLSDLKTCWLLLFYIFGSWKHLRFGLVGWTAHEIWIHHRSLWDIVTCSLKLWFVCMCGHLIMETIVLIIVSCSLNLEKNLHERIID